MGFRGFGVSGVGGVVGGGLGDLGVWVLKVGPGKASGGVGFRV